MISNIPEELKSYTEKVSITKNDIQLYPGKEFQITLQNINNMDKIINKSEFSKRKTIFIITGISLLIILSVIFGVLIGLKGSCTGDDCNQMDSHTVKTSPINPTKDKFGKTPEKEIKK